MSRYKIIILLLLVTVQSCAPRPDPIELPIIPFTLPVSAPLNTGSAGINGVAAIQSVVRVLCLNEGTGGTGFIHKSGKIITASHVVKTCNEVSILSAANTTPIRATIIASDPTLDLALLDPKQAVSQSPLKLSAKEQLSVGAQLTTWGFPAGYPGKLPLLSVGYLSGEVGFLIDGHVILQWVVNAAFNSGNSGGPLLDVETGEVVGVVSSKLAPLSPTSLNALAVLESQASGLTYEATFPNGTKKTLVEGNIVAMVLNDLRSQVQLVIGQAVKIGNIRDFIKKQGIDP